MKKIAVLISNGTEELEALTPVDLLRRCDGASCDLVSIDGEFVTGSHAIVIRADMHINDFDMSKYDAIVVPGGMPGASNIAKNLLATKALKQAFAEKKLVASICASPAVVLAKQGLVEGKKLTCYPAKVFVEALTNCTYTASHVQVDGNLITADGPESAFEFAREIAKYLQLEPKF